MYQIVKGAIFSVFLMFAVINTVDAQERNSFTIEIPQENRVGERGDRQSLGIYGIPISLQGKPCNITLSARNDTSIHTGNDLFFEFGSDEFEIENVENEQNETKYTYGYITEMTDSVEVFLRYSRREETSSVGATVEIDCSGRGANTPQVTGSSVQSPDSSVNQEVSATPTSNASPTPDSTVTPTPTHGERCESEAPGRPTLLSVERSGNRGVTLKWSDPDGSVNRYVIDYGQVSKNYDQTVETQGVVTSYTINDLELSGEYYFAVKAQRECALSDYSNELRFPKGQQVDSLAKTDSGLLEVLVQLLVMGGLGIGGYSALRLAKGM